MQPSKRGPDPLTSTPCKRAYNRSEEDVEDIDHYLFKRGIEVEEGDILKFEEMVVLQTKVEALVKGFPSEPGASLEPFCFKEVEAAFRFTIEEYQVQSQLLEASFNDLAKQRNIWSSLFNEIDKVKMERFITGKSNRIKEKHEEFDTSTKKLNKMKESTCPFLST